MTEMNRSLIELAENVRAALMTYAPLGQEFGADVAVDYLRDAEELVAKLRQHTAEQPQEVVEKLYQEYRTKYDQLGMAYYEGACDALDRAIAAMNMGDASTRKDEDGSLCIGKTSPASSEISAVDEKEVETAIGGSYEILDGRQFWMDRPVVLEILRRIRPYLRTTEPVDCIEAIKAGIAEARTEFAKASEDFNGTLSDDDLVAFIHPKVCVATMPVFVGQDDHDDSFNGYERRKSRPPVPVSLEKCVKAIEDCVNISRDTSPVALSKAVLDTAGVKYGD